MWEPRAVIVMFIAICVSLAALIGVFAVAWRGTRLTEVGGDILIAILGAMVAIIAGYVGREFNGRGRTEARSKQPPHSEADQADGSRTKSHSGGAGEASDERSSERGTGPEGGGHT